VVPGKVTIIEYFADWCAPCKKLEIQMAEVLLEEPAVAVVKVDIVDWGTPAADMIAGVAGLPVLDIYDAEGEFVERLERDAAFDFKKRLDRLQSGLTPP